jgi:ferrochelatase
MRARSGHRALAAICLAPQFSELSVGLYIRRTREAAAEAGVTAEIVWAKSYHDEPLLIEAFAERCARCCRPARCSSPRTAAEAGAGGGRSVRSRMPRHGRRGGRARSGVADWDFAFQSQGLTGGRGSGPPWNPAWTATPPRVCAKWCCDPVGFVCDHVETLFDIDILFREYAAATRHRAAPSEVAERFARRSRRRWPRCEAMFVKWDSDRVCLQLAHRQRCLGAAGLEARATSAGRVIPAR